MPTKRVMKDRYKANIMGRRRFEAMGGYNSLFFGAISGYAAHTFAGVRGTPLVTPYFSQAGINSIARSGMYAAGPALLGVWAGIYAFGDVGECWNLLRNGGLYRREFRAIRQESFSQ